MEFIALLIKLTGSQNLKVIPGLPECVYQVQIFEMNQKFFIEFSVLSLFFFFVCVTASLMSK